MHDACSRTYISRPFIPVAIIVLHIAYPIAEKQGMVFIDAFIFKVARVDVVSSLLVY